MRNQAIQCLDRAEKLLRSGDEDSLRYACLELRTALELFCYEKLDGYLKDLPVESAKLWKPKEVMMALTEIDPDAEFSAKLSFWKEDESGEPEAVHDLGEYRSFGGKWASKTHHFLSNFLHAPTLHAHKKNKSPDVIANLGKLWIVHQELNRIGSAKIIKLRFSLNNVSFNCSSCEMFISRKSTSITDGGIVRCPNCGSVHKAQVDNGEWYFNAMRYTYSCGKCDTENEFGAHELFEGSKIYCSLCNHEHLISQKWGIFIEKSSNEVPPAADKPSNA